MNYTQCTQYSSYCNVKIAHNGQNCTLRLILYSSSNYVGIKGVLETLELNIYYRVSII